MIGPVRKHGQKEESKLNGEFLNILNILLRINSDLEPVKPKNVETNLRSREERQKWQNKERRKIDESLNYLRRLQERAQKKREKALEKQNETLEKEQTGLANEEHELGNPLNQLLPAQGLLYDITYIVRLAIVKQLFDHFNYLNFISFQYSLGLKFFPS